MKAVFQHIKDFFLKRTLADFLYLGLGAFLIIRLYDHFIYSGAEYPALNILFFLPVLFAFAYLLYELILIVRRDRKSVSTAFVLLILVIYLYLVFEFLSMAYLVFT